MERKTVRSGLVGAGFAANFHYESIQRVHGADVEVVGVFDSDADRAAAFAKERGLKAMDSLEALIDACDVVHACVPPVAHEPVAVAALERDTFVIVEKPFTGYFGDGSEDFDGRSFPKEAMLEGALASIERMLAAEQASRARICYAENFIYAPAVQKEREIIEKTGAQILWMIGEEGHSGSHSPVYGIWRFAGGGSLMGKSCHPLSAVLYFKRVEGRTRDGTPIRPKAVSARTHRLTTGPAYRDAGHLRCNYEDVEDFGHIHIIFEDGMVADVFASEILRRTTPARSTSRIFTWSRRPAPSRGGRIPRRTRTTSTATRTRWRRSTARWPTATSPRAPPPSAPTPSPSSTPPTSPTKRAAPRCRSRCSDAASRDGLCVARPACPAGIPGVRGGSPHPPRSVASSHGACGGPPRRAFPGPRQSTGIPA